MSKIFTWIIAAAAVAAVSAPTYAGMNLPNGLTSNGLNLQAVRLVMPDGVELSLR
jgi:hypothetical protein